MARTIIFGMLQESGHLHPTFRLARELVAEGFEVAYFAAPELAELVQGQGFSVLPWPSPGETASGSLLAKRRAVTQAFSDLTSQLARGEGPMEQLARLKPAFTLVDVTQPTLSFALRAAGLPFALVHTSLPQTRAPGVVPLRLAAPYEASWIGRVKARLAWDRFLARRQLQAQLVRPLGITPPYAIARRRCQEFGIAPQDLDCATVYMPQLKGAPELVLCPRAFDFPRPDVEQRFYVESVDTARREQPFVAQRLSPTLPLVYASLGSQLYGQRAALGFLRRLLRVFATRPEWQLVLSLGRHARPSDFGECPPNVVLLDRAPQLALLRRAQVMITHGGLGSVKECILHGVPMLAVPLAVDQPGNAARIVHHGLGLRADVSRSTERELADQLFKLLHDEPIRARVGTMKQQFEAVEAAQLGARKVVQWAGDS